MTMKKFLIGTTVLGLLLILPFRSMIVETVTARTERIEVVKEGDVIFQTSQSKQSPLIQIGTRSKITHCGIIVMKNGKPYVLCKPSCSLHWISLSLVAKMGNIG